MKNLHYPLAERVGSNPRYVAVHLISSQTPSTTRTPLRVNQPYLLYHKSVFCKEFFLFFSTAFNHSSLCQPVFRASASEKILHHLCTLGFTYTADDLCRMIKIGITDDIKDRLCPSGFSIRTTVNNLVDTTVDDSARTHRTGLDCNIKRSPSNRQRPSFLHASLITMTSACAVASFQVSRILCALATTSPSTTSTAPIGISPIAAAVRASCSANCIYSSSVITFNIFCLLL